MDYIIFPSPLAYIAILGTTALVRNAGYLKPFNPLYHNYNMIFQSGLLLSLTINQYVQTMMRCKFPWYAFIEISNAHAKWNQDTITTHWWSKIVLATFLISKVFEWFDTVALIINKKKIIALHLWNHATIGVAFYTGYFCSSVLWIGGLNSFIHIIMYAYYANIQGVRRIAKYLTQLQIIQLFGGVYMNYVSYNQGHIPRYQRYAVINGFICLSYGLMFLQFYGKKYKKSRKEKGVTQAPPRHIIINDNKYDITHFKHPGGSVIEYMTNGQNATEAFNEFHFRSKKAHAVLNSLPHEKIVERHSTDREVLDDFASFRQSLIDRGFFEPSNSLIVYRFCEQALLYGAGVYFMSRNISLSILCISLFKARCGWIQHEGGHNSLTGNMKTDKLIQEFFIGFGLHTSGIMWNKMHNKHHATPQKSKYDIDLDTTPLVAFYDTAVESNRRKAFSRTWLKYQMYTFLPITSGIFVPLLWILYLHPREVFNARKWRQFGFMVLGNIAPILLFMYCGGCTPLKSTLYAATTLWLANMYLFGHFSLSHTTTDVISENTDPSWVRYAIEHSVDISVGNPIVDWIMGYLNYQVIHHLFPSMPQYRGPEVSRELVAFCDKHGIVYKRIGYFRAWYEMFANLNRVGEVYQAKTKTE